MKNEEKKYNYFYKITNNINGMYYFGVHSTDNLNDGYFGSGKYLKRAIRKYGKENFKKEILEFFKTSTEALEYEASIVTEELVNDPKCYNLSKGGGYKESSLTVYDTEKKIKLKVDEYEYRANPDRYVHPSTNLVSVRDKDGNTFSTSVDDPRFLSGELVGVAKGTIRAKINGVIVRIPADDPRVRTGEAITDLKYHTKIMARDEHGNLYKIYKDDPRLSSGELLKVYKTGKRKVSKEIDGKIVIRFIDQEELDSYLGSGWSNKAMFLPSTKGMIRIYKILDDGSVKRSVIPPEEFEKYNQDGWIRGNGPNKKRRFNSEYTHQKTNAGKIHINKDEVNKLIFPEELDDYVVKGWKVGIYRKVNTSHSTGKIHIHREDENGNVIENTMIFRDNFSEYKNSGWIEGIGKRSKKIK